MRSVSRRPKVAMVEIAGGGVPSSRKASVRRQSLPIGRRNPPYHDIGLPAPMESAVSVIAALPEDGEPVRLLVYGWHNVQPGTLSWVFPSVDAAVLAVAALTNAIRWAIVRGTDLLDVEAARASNAIVLERA